MMKKDIKAIYVVTAVKKNSQDPWGADDRRCFGWYADYETAEERVINNELDIHEFYHNYAVIEKAYEGLYGTMYSFYEEQGQVWFKYDENTGKYEHIETPKWAQRIFGWGIG